MQEQTQDFSKLEMVARDGIEPPTPAFSGLRAFLRGGIPLALCSRMKALAPRLPRAQQISHFESYGGQGRNRTADASLFRAALYRLSYLAISGELHTCSFGGTGEDFVRTERFRL
jgi:hypothetical protein